VTYTIPNDPKDPVQVFHCLLRRKKGKESSRAQLRCRKSPSKPQKERSFEKREEMVRESTSLQDYTEESTKTIKRNKTTKI